MSENMPVKVDEIQSRIHTIRGVQVMLDKDLAVFYGVKPIRLREQVKRNIKRFPVDFMFQLTENEAELMVSQNAIPSKQSMGGSMPYAFTEQGVAAISAVLTSERAIIVNIQIMRAFVAMRRFIAVNAEVFQRLDAVERRQIEDKVDADHKFEQIFNAIEEQSIKPKQGIFFEGQVFDAHQFISDLIRTARKSIIVIDNYIDDTVLTLLSRADKKVAITIKEFRNSHDRFFIIDDKTVYHFGSSLKDLGKKWFAFSRFDRDAFKLLERLEGVVGE